MKKKLWIVFVFSAVAIGLYPVLYFVIDREFGLLSTKSPALLRNLLWNTGFYIHIVGGGIAMLTGWPQFLPALRTRHPGLHRNLGKVYVVTAVFSGIAGCFIAFYATGGWIAAAGFAGLALVWLYTTLGAYRHIRKGRVQAHQRLMLYSYAACFAAVTLRIWFPLLTMAFHDFIPAYRLSAWLCWVPNLLVVRWWLQPKPAGSQA